ncbi:hypothetical protein BDV95DRAFT_570838 [Massariosphaeria phaeospora]|uniref:Uncharacterized protein n=1 Tax=Massariosphaeria phaeospora TaxID=100035 RepID=A0A7C8MC97_9PLEO|nr:hypothetical protein BDV95DRAFT_570838 [Massariosphaeria phaeospora]
MPPLSSDKDTSTVSKENIEESVQRTVTPEGDTEENNKPAPAPINKPKRSLPSSSDEEHSPSQVSKKRKLLAPPSMPKRSLPDDQILPPSLPKKLKMPTTWAELFPPRTKMKQHKFRQDPALAARHAKIRELLAELNTSIDIREELMDLARKDPGMYRQYDPRNIRWKRKAQEHARYYYRVEKEVREIGDSEMATRQKVQLWENWLKAVREWTLAPHDEQAEDNWDWYPVVDKGGVLKPDWSWDQPVGAGPGLDELVDPLDTTKKNTHEDAGKYVNEFHKLAPSMLESDSD